MTQGQDRGRQRRRATPGRRDGPVAGRAESGEAEAGSADFDLDGEDERTGGAEITGRGLAEAELVSCPYCAAPVELLIDAGGGAVQEYVEDCEVCCQPWSVRVHIGAEGAVSVSVSTLDEE